MRRIKFVEDKGKFVRFAGAEGGRAAATATRGLVVMISSLERSVLVFQ